MNFLLATEKFPSRERIEESAGELERGGEKERKRREKEGVRDNHSLSSLFLFFYFPFLLIFYFL